MQRRTLVSKEDRSWLLDKDSGFPRRRGNFKEGQTGEIDPENDMGFRGGGGVSEKDRRVSRMREGFRND